MRVWGAGGGYRILIRLWACLTHPTPCVTRVHLPSFFIGSIHGFAILLLDDKQQVLGIRYGFEGFTARGAKPLTAGSLSPRAMDTLHLSGALPHGSTGWWLTAIEWGCLTDFGRRLPRSGRGSQLPWTYSYRAMEVALASAALPPDSLTPSNPPPPAHTLSSTSSYHCQVVLAWVARFLCCSRSYLSLPSPSPTSPRWLLPGQLLLPHLQR